MASEAADLRLSFPCSGNDLTAAEACEQRVFGRRYGNTEEQFRAEYGPYAAGTLFGAVLREDGRALGTVRVLRGGADGLKTLQDAAAPPWSLPVDAVCRSTGLDPESTWDVATFGVDTDGHGAGSRRVTLALLALLFAAMRDNAATSFVAILDEGARRPFAALGVQVADLPGASPAGYLGSPASVPVYAHLSDLHHRHGSGPAELHGQVFHGRGIAGVDPEATSAGRFATTAVLLSQGRSAPQMGAEVPSGAPARL